MYKGVRALILVITRCQRA